MSEIKKSLLDVDSLLINFNLTRKREGEKLSEWLLVNNKLNDLELQKLHKLQQKALKSIDGWNEEELKMKFISLIFDLADIEADDKISLFFERALSETIENFKLSVICDCMLASPAGISTPKSPYFFLQERNAARFKKQKGDSNDPEGQMLAAMLIAQKRNNDKIPLYGAWLVGSNWRFTTLIEKEYCVSHQFDASNEDDLIQIVLILRKLKQIILASHQ